VKGYILNQFSIDYYNNYLRIATTTNSKWGLIENKEDGTTDYGEISPSTNQVYILQKDGINFKIINEINNLGTTERIYSVRFVKDYGYIVTFRIIDPLYTIDLSNPYDAKVLGELKISGFSNYIHPITLQDDEKYLLTIGQEANETTGEQLGLQISLFDINDMYNPTLVQKRVIEDTSSNAQYNHHAFRYLPKSQVLIIPVSSKPYKTKKKDLFDGFHLYTIAPSNINKIREVVHADFDLIKFYNNCFSNVYLDARSLVFSGDLVTIKGHSVMNSGNIFDLNHLDDESNWYMNFDAKNKKNCMNWFPWSR